MMIITAPAGSKSTTRINPPGAAGPLIPAWRSKLSSII
jgi:hypothetical protein